jgi:hypothetical protein
MKITGLPEHLRDYSLAYYHWFATGEGVTNEAELLCCPTQIPSIGQEGMIELIPAVVEKEIVLADEEYVYFDWNPRFKAVFLEQFGVDDWISFTHVCLQHKGFLNLIKKSHYNLS